MFDAFRKDTKKSEVDAYKMGYLDCQRGLDAFLDMDTVEEHVADEAMADERIEDEAGTGATDEVEANEQEVVVQESPAKSSM
ncbi:hypothetical protein Pyn_22199 [Prunus yedoensis var. nudiflora]|uniref:Uncharacterized protein n=1 Tax=Prunus yedoensis var. nudiflora TaxID=2094558 RepID=A0A314ZLQ3_PRUYE|nr:hypothetical protein Pyn_22199 [Prunus yedoensis var. nudiflora]